MTVVQRPRNRQRHHQRHRRALSPCRECRSCTPAHHGLHDMLSRLPSKIAYGVLQVDLDGRDTVQIPRRELWDVRVQLMAEADADNKPRAGAGPGEARCQDGHLRRRLQELGEQRRPG